jgi:hypothetical protein
MAQEMDDVDLDTMIEQSAGGLETQQASTDNSRTALFAAYSAIMRQSSRVRNTKIPGLSSPFGFFRTAIGGIDGRLPVAIMSLSHGYQLPSSQ